MSCTKFILYSFIQVQARRLVPFQIIDLWAFQIPTSFQVTVYYTSFTFLLPVNIHFCVAPWQTVMHPLVFFYITSSHCYMLLQIYKGLFGFIFNVFNVFQFTPAFPGDYCDRILRYVTATPLYNCYFTIHNNPNIKLIRNDLAVNLESLSNLLST
jgi:hypothetical protein